MQFVEFLFGTDTRFFLLEIVRIVKNFNFKATKHQRNAIHRPNIFQLTCGTI